MTAALIRLATDADEAAENVRPGWIPLLIVLALGAFVVFLFFSLRKQLGRIDFPEEGAGAERDEEQPPTP